MSKANRQKAEVLIGSICNMRSKMLVDLLVAEEIQDSVLVTKVKEIRTNMAEVIKHLATRIEKL